MNEVRGLVPARQLDGGVVPTPNEYIVTTGQIIYRGDLVSAVAAGTVQAAAVGDATIVIGVAAENVDDSASAGGKKILVYDHPYTVFAVRADSGGAVSVAATAVFATADHVAGAGNTTTKWSGHELDASNIGTGNQLRILGKVDRVDNDWGLNVLLEVLIAEHAYNVNTSI